MSISCSHWAADDGRLVHTSCRSRFAHLFGRAQPVQLMRAPRASIMSISCFPSSLASPPLSASSGVCRVFGTAFAPKRSLHRSNRVLSSIYSAVCGFLTFSEAPEPPWARCRNRFARFFFGRGTSIVSISYAACVAPRFPSHPASLQ